MGRTLCGLGLFKATGFEILRVIAYCLQKKKKEEEFLKDDQNADKK